MVFCGGLWCLVPPVTTHDSGCFDSAIVIVFSIVVNYRITVLIVSVLVDFHLV